MAGRRTWRGALSGADLGASLEPPAGDALPQDGDRFEQGGLLGVGGMGEVRLARDRVLERDVAIKIPRQHDADASRMLLAEARLTARLEHPGIVPVHMAGLTSDGRPYYAMRLLRGRSLAEALAGMDTVQQRLGLVRRLLDVADAMAFAHHAGVLHRDLKPANVLVGPYGETVVSDWGLAIDVTEPVGPQSHSSAGTPGYMSPEQQRGQALDARSDVYAVGAMLHELLYGAPPSESGREIRGEVPPEIAAIARRATARQVAERYPDMESLSADLEAWFEGRRVSAHSYTPRELLVRLVRAWRAPLLVAAVGAALVALAVGVGWTQTVAERDRAVTAEEDAVRSLGMALVVQARLAAQADRRPEAELLAAHALVAGPSPEARGVLARFGGRARPILDARQEQPACIGRALSPDGRRLVCRDERGLTLLDLPGGEVVARLDEGFQGVVFAGSSEHLVMARMDGGFATWTPPAAPVPVDLGLSSLAFLSAGLRPGTAVWMQGSKVGGFDVGAGTSWSGSGCGQVASPSVVAGGPDGSALVGCSDGWVNRIEPSGAVGLAQAVDPAGAPRALAWAPDGGGTLAIGTPRGRVVVIGLGDGSRRSFEVAGAAVRAILPGPGRMVVATEDGAVTVIDLGRGEVEIQWSAVNPVMAWVGGSEVLRVVGASMWDWRLGEAPRPHRWAFPAGVASLTSDPTGRWAAVSLGDGSVHVRRLEDGLLMARLAWQTDPAKDVAVSPDGAWLAIAVAGGQEQRIYRTSDWSVSAVLPVGKLRRVAWLTDGALLADPFSSGLQRLESATGWRPEQVLDDQLWELEATADGGVAAIGLDGTIWRMGADGRGARPLMRGTAAGAVVALGEETLVGSPWEVVRLDANGDAAQRWPVPGDPVDFALSGDRRWLAVGYLDGGVDVMATSDGALLARLEGHENRVPAVAFTADDAWLITGSWDATVRIWSLADLETPADELVARASADWGQSLEEVLSQGR